MSDHHHSTAITRGNNRERQYVLAIDVGAGTQDVLIYDSERTPENCFKFVLPSQTQIVAQRIKAVTDQGKPVHLSGFLMGGGASTEAITNHLAQGLKVTATADAARTIHNDLDRVRSAGVVISESLPAEAVELKLQDIDIVALQQMLEGFGIEMPADVAVAVQDHGYRPGGGNNEVRFEYLQSLIDAGGSLERMVFTQAPAHMIRMESVAEAIPGVKLMDTGAAAVLGSLADPLVAATVNDEGAILVNVGNMHTFATLVKGKRLYGLFEHHTGGISEERIAELVDLLRQGELDPALFAERYDGHGAAVSADYADEGPFEFVSITGPNRGIASDLGYHQAAPHGDMMLTGAYGLAAGALFANGLDPADFGLLPAAAN